MKKTIITLTIIAALALSLAGCSSAPAAEPETPAAENEAAAPEAQVTEDVPSPTEEDGQTASPETPAVPGRQDGERFEEVIILEGMEETVGYEHVRNEAAGFEMDYEYEDLERRTTEDGECFISRWDSPEDPWNYLELRYDKGNAEQAADAVKATLSGVYETVEEEPFTLDGVGACVRIDASGVKNGAPAGSMQTVYVIPAGEGSLVATAHYTIESAEGFGARFSYMLNTLSLING
jgi:predicted small lipoprotein YifL